jgi:CotH kinase protein/Lamin Tail Domain
MIRRNLWVAAGLLLALQSAIAESPGPSSRRTGWVISEIHYHPADRTDGRNLEFVELQNTEVFPEDLGGFRLEGELNVTFPASLMVPAGGYVVVAPSPGDVAAVYGISGVYAGSTNRLANSGGSLRLRNPAGAILGEVAYSDDAPWPVGADGGGPSLVLFRPSFGEADPRAWEASARVGGSPGGPEPSRENDWQSVTFNELQIRTTSPAGGFLELYHRGTGSVNLSGCLLTSDPATPGHRLPNPTILDSGGRLALDETQLGFRLNPAGGSLFLFNPDSTRLIDALKYGPRVSEMAFGRFPDGSPRWTDLMEPTPGLPNTQPFDPPIVIHELMYHPPEGSGAVEFVELHNRSGQRVDVGGWRFVDGIDFTLPAGTAIPAGGFLAVAADVNQLRTHHPGLSAANSAGNFSGSLSNSGERIALARPELQTETQGDGSLKTNVVFVVVDEVTYADGGSWGRWSDGGGSSLELIDARADNRLARQWADSDESGKSAWAPIELTGVLDHGVGAVDRLQVLLQGEGACLIDDIEVRGAATANLVSNGTFANSSAGWTASGTHAASGRDAAAAAYRVDTVGRGDTGANRVQTALNPGLNPGDTGTLRARGRWLRGHPEVLLRIRGNYLEAVGSLPIPANLGTPGAPNSRALPNAGPVITDATHSPVLPVASQPVLITARVEDPDGVSSVELRFRTDPSTVLTTLPMTDDGTGADRVAADGIYSASLPGRPRGSLVAWHVVARDAADATAEGRYPAGAPEREAMVRYGESRPAGALGTYRMWITQTNFTRWSNRSKLDNAPIDLTFVYNDERVVHGVGGIYAGSPHISPGYNTPAGNLCGYVLTFPGDEPFLGVSDVVLDWPGRDTTAVQEPFAYWLARELRIPFNHRRYIRLHVNGVTDTTRGSIYEDAQQVNSDLLASWLPDATGGDLYKIEQWFEFNDGLGTTQVGPPRLENYTTTGGAKKTARYRWSWLKRAVDSSANDFDSLFTLVDVLNTPRAETYSRQVNAFVDLDEWMRIFATENIVCGFDSYGHDIGKNMYAYKPPGGRWQLFMWDIDWVMLSSAQHGFTPQASLMYRGPARFGDGNRDPVIGRMYEQPEFQRAYWRAVLDAAEGPLRPERVAARLDAVASALKANGVTRSAGGTLTDPGEVKSWLVERRAFLLEQLATVNASFALTSPASDTSQSSNLVTLTGTAPITVKDLRVNGVVTPATWTTVTSWRLTVPLTAEVNRLEIDGLDLRGLAVPGARASVTVRVTTTPDRAEDRLVINEIQYQPIIPGAGYVELHNASTRTAFDLGGARLEGVDVTLPEGTWIPPGGFLLVAADRGAFARAHGMEPTVAAEFSGSLDSVGETLRLVRPATAGAPESLLDVVRFEGHSPWPVGTEGAGASLQLLDPSLDNRRPGNWFVASKPSEPPPSRVLLPMTATWRFQQSGIAPDSSWRSPGFNDTAWGSGPALLYVEPDPLPGPKQTLLTLGATTFYFRTHFSFDGDPSAVGLALSTILDDAAVVYLNGREVFRLGMPDGTPTHSTLAARNVSNAALEGPFQIPSDGLQRGDNVLAVEVHQIAATSSDIAWGMTLSTIPPTGPSVSTPGAPNRPSSPVVSLPPLWLNELVADNRSGIADATGERGPWVEILNDSAFDVPLTGLALTDDLSAPPQWFFPDGAILPAGARTVVWLDGHPERQSALEWHTGFRISPAEGTLALLFRRTDEWVVADHLQYSALAPDHSLGFPTDGAGAERIVFAWPTPGRSNEAGRPRIRINEWMASNRSTLRDPADREFKDWFELHNAESVTVDLGGSSLTDDPTLPRKFVIPAGTRISPGGHLLVWADENGSLNQPGGDLHANFKLSQDGESIAVLAPDGFLLDQVVFGQQLTDVAQGRWPDGATGPFVTPSRATPRQANVPPAGAVVEIPIYPPEVTTDGTVVIRWTSVPGARYRVESLDTLAPGPWTPLTGDLTATGTTSAYQDQPSAERTMRFYRILSAL